MYTEAGRAAYVGIGTTHEVAVEHRLAHLRGDYHGLYAVTAPDFFGYGPGEVRDAQVLHERARRRGDLVTTLQTL